MTKYICILVNKNGQINFLVLVLTNNIDLFVYTINRIANSSENNDCWIGMEGWCRYKTIVNHSSFCYGRENVKINVAYVITNGKNFLLTKAFMTYTYVIFKVFLVRWEEGRMIMCWSCQLYPETNPSLNCPPQQSRPLFSYVTCHSM